MAIDMNPAARIWANAWNEYDSAAEWCAKRDIKGKDGDPLPANMSSLAVGFINEDPEAFQMRVRQMAYGIAMEKLNLPEDPEA